MKVQVERFHLNGHSIGFRPQTQKLEIPDKSRLFTLAVKGLEKKSPFCFQVDELISRSVYERGLITWF